jgi:hypothetical protein
MRRNSLRARDWSQFPVIADIGGGIGAQLSNILDAHPSSGGILFDQPQGLGKRRSIAAWNASEAIFLRKFQYKLTLICCMSIHLLMSNSAGSGTTDSTNSKRGRGLAAFLVDAWPAA